MEAEMLQALLVATALALSAAGPSFAQTSPAPTSPATPAQPGTQRMAPPAQGRAATAPARVEGSHLIGLRVRNGANESIGEIDDVIVDRDGRVRQVVVSVGGFLGIGERKVALGWNQLRFDANRDVAMVNLTKDQLRAMPEYRAARATPGTAPAAGSSNPPPATRQP